MFHAHLTGTVIERDRRRENFKKIYSWNPKIFREK